MTEWIKCELLRHVDKQSCIVRICSSGAVVQAGLLTPLDLTRACLISPLKPTACRLGIKADSHSLEACELEVDWPAIHSDMPPPARFQRKKWPQQPVHKRKRRRANE
jgi:hypothetical protein